MKKNEVWWSVKFWGRTWLDSYFVAIVVIVVFFYHKAVPFHPSLLFEQFWYTNSALQILFGLAGLKYMFKMFRESMAWNRRGRDGIKNHLTITLPVTEASLQGKTVTDKLKNVSAQVNYTSKFNCDWECNFFHLFITRL